MQHLNFVYQNVILANDVVLPSDIEDDIKHCIIENDAQIAKTLIPLLDELYDAERDGLKKYRIKRIINAIEMA